MKRSGKQASKLRRRVSPKASAARGHAVRTVGETAAPAAGDTPIESASSAGAVPPAVPPTEERPRAVKAVEERPISPAPAATSPPTPPVIDSLPADSIRRVEEFLGFRLDNEEYAVWIRSVREIIRPTEITPIPRSPADILGIISLRGTIVPIFDLRRRLGLPRRESDPKSRIIVIVIDGAPVGMVVDQVTEVIMADPEELEPPPTTMGEQEASFVTATLRHRERLLGVLHLERLVAIEPATPLRAMA